MFYSTQSVTAKTELQNVWSATISQRNHYYHQYNREIILAALRKELYEGYTILENAKTRCAWSGQAKVANKSLGFR